MIFSGGTTTEGSLAATWRHHQGEIGSGPTDRVSAVAILAAHPRSRPKGRQRRRARSQLADQHPAQAHDRDQQRRKKAIHPKRQTIDGPHQLGARGRNLDPETTGLLRQLLVEGVVLGTLGAAVAAVVAWLALSGLVRLVPDGITLYSPFSLGMERRDPPAEMLVRNRDEERIRAESWPEPVPEITDDMALAL